MIASADQVIELRAADANSNTMAQLWFSEPIDSSSAMISSNFCIDGLAIYSSYRENGDLGIDRVLLETSPMADSIYTVEISGLTSQGGNTMNPEYDSFEFVGWAPNTTYYHKMRWMGDSMGYGNWTIYYEPRNTVYNRFVSYIEGHQQGTGIELDEHNYSISGARAYDLLLNQLPPCVRDEPDLVVVEIGGNDWPSTPFDNYLRQLDAILRILSRELPEAKVFVCNFHTSVLNHFPNGGGGYTIEQWMWGIEQVARRYDMPVIDIYNLFLGYTEPDGWYICRDGTHPNTCGYVYMSILFLDLLQKTPPKPMSFTASYLGHGALAFDCEFYPEDNVTTAVQIYEDGEYLITIERDELPYVMQDMTPNHSYRARSETDQFYPEIHLSAFTPEVTTFQLEISTSNIGGSQISQLTLEPAIPNPFNNETLLSYSIPEITETAALSIFNTLGQEVHSVSLNAGGGYGVYRWKAGENSAGIYFVVLSADGVVITQKLILLR